MKKNNLECFKIILSIFMLRVPLTLYYIMLPNSKKQQTYPVHSPCIHCGKTNHTTSSCLHRHKKSSAGTGCGICKKNNHIADACYFRDEVISVICTDSPPTDRLISFPVEASIEDYAIFIDGSYLYASVQVVGQRLFPGIDPDQIILNQALFLMLLRIFTGLEFTTRIILQGTLEGKPTPFINNMSLFEPKIGGLKIQNGRDPVRREETCIMTERGLDVSLMTGVFNACLGLMGHASNKNILVITGDAGLLSGLYAWSKLTPINVLSMSNQDPLLAPFNLGPWSLDDVLMQCVELIAPRNTKDKGA